MDSKKEMQNIQMDLVELSYRNLVTFYASELRMIFNGIPPEDVLEFCVRRKFRRLGVFKKYRGSNELSDKALTILKRIE